MIRRYCQLIAFVLLPVLAVTQAEVIDDFTTPTLNNLGGVRGGQGVYTMLTYPRLGIAIPKTGDYLVEPLNPGGFQLSLSDKLLRIEYTAFSSGGRTIQYYQPSVDQANGDVAPEEYTVSFSQGRNHIDIPLSSIASGSSSHVFGIGGPLFVHRLDLVDTAETNELASVEYIGTGPISVLNLYALRHFETPPQRAFRRFMTVVNLNVLGSRRGGMGIERYGDGIKIFQHGVLFESLGTDTIDLSTKHVRIVYSAETGGWVSVKLRYRAGSVQDGEEVASTVDRFVQIGERQVLDIAVSAFPRIRLRDCKSIWISGQVTVHKIKFESRGRWIRNTIPVDDMRTWPLEAAGPNLMHIRPTEAFPEIGRLSLPTNSRGIAWNNIDLPATGNGVSLGNGGIKLSEQGYIYQQLSASEKVYDLSHTRVEIEYSAEHKVTRMLNVLSVVPNDLDDNFHVEPVSFILDFTQGDRNSVLVDVGVCGPSAALRITGLGEVTLHKISLLTTVFNEPGSSTTDEPAVLPTINSQARLTDNPDVPPTENTEATLTDNPHVPPTGTVTTVILDDFIDWPLLGDDVPPAPRGSVHIPSITRHAIEPSEYAGYYYSLTGVSNPPVLRNCQLVTGNGVEIMDGGYLSQLHPPNEGMHVRIKYSSKHLGTQRIVFVKEAWAGSHQGNLMETTNHVMFNSGEYKMVVFPVYGYFRNTVLAIRIHGPLFVHQIEYIYEPRHVYSEPGQSAPDGLLIDDFSNMDLKENSNIVNGERFTTGLLYPGSVTLRKFSDYLVEGFQGEWNMENLQFRITYTASESMTCKMMLISELGADHEWYGPHPQDAPEFGNVVFKKGERMKIRVPALQFMRNMKDKSAPVYGIAVHGPEEGGPLTVHRIEMVGQFLFGESMKPSTPEMRLSRMVGDYEWI